MVNVLLFFKRHTSEIRLLATTVLLITALFVVWNISSQWLRVPALIAAPVVLLIVLAFCPLAENLENPDDIGYPVWKGCLCALTVVMLYLVWPIFWAILGCITLMGITYFLGILFFGMSCIGHFDDSAAEW